MATKPVYSAPVVREPRVPRPVIVPVAVETPVATSCNCATGSGFEQKIKENPLLFVLGALLIGYLLAKN